MELTDFVLPKGSIRSHPILTNLLQALHVEGILARIPACVRVTDNWILNASLPNSIIDIPSQFKGMQSVCLHFLISTSLYQNEPCVSKFQSFIEGKLSVTLQSRHSDYDADLQFTVNWFHSLYICL